MWHELVGDENAFFSALIEIDEQLATTVQERGCPCGGRLDRADYHRKPRGIPREWDDVFCRRFSFCCAIDGCRKRATPPSVRFFGRRVYVAAVILLVCGGRVTARTAEVPKNTARRWRRFFDTAFLATPFWRDARGRFMPPIIGEVVEAVMARFLGDTKTALSTALRFFSPVTTASAEMMAG